MAEICISITAKVAAYFVNPIIHHARYLLCFNQFIRDVGNAKTELESTLASVKERAKEAARKTEEITQPVKKWVNDVETILQEVRNLQRKTEQGRFNCFHVSLRYSVSKEMANKVDQMKKLNNNTKFEPFSLIMQLPGIHYFSSKDFVYFNSTKSAYDELLKAIKDDKSKMIGLYGMGGSGKTTLAKEVGKRVQELKLFDHVVMVVVSQTTNVRNIQGQIADQINFEMKEETEFGRAQRLSTRLQQEKNLLLILDDVWENLNFEDIGIPSNGNTGCCVVVTTRLQRVCASMGCQRIIELSLLTEEEAWALFKLRANITNDFSNELKGVARNISDECKGLLVAIVTVGSTLKGKSFLEWKLALSRLKNSRPMDIEEGLRSPYACLKLSYDNLKNPVAQSLLLLCSMFPEDHNINKEDLIRFGKGVLELDEIVDTMEEAREEIYVAINVLLDSCLLIPTKKHTCVKMHDLVRDVALWIATKESQAITVASKAVPTKLMENETVNDTKVISLWELEENFKLSDQLHCPTLKILLLHYNYQKYDKPNIYVGGMRALKVLALIRFKFHFPVIRRNTWSMPQSIKLLTNLCTLCLRGNDLGDLSFLSSLKGLEILDLRGSSFDELPIGIVDMKRLKLLDLFGCAIKKSPYEVIVRCLQLQELMFLGEQSIRPENVSFPSFDRYVIFVSSNSVNVEEREEPYNEFGLTVEELEPSRSLGMSGYDVSTLNSSMKDHLFRADLLYLDKCRWDDEELFSKVKHLILGGCPTVKFLVDHNADHHVNIVQGQEALKLNSDLSRLALIELPELELIWKGPTHILSLQRLEFLHIRGCPKLKTIFSPTIVTSLPELTTLWLAKCNGLEGIMSAHLDSLTNLSASSHNVCFPKLSEIWIKDCNKFKCLFSYSLASHCPSLTKVKILNCSELERVVDGFEGTGHGDGVLFPKLTDLTLNRLPKLTHIFPGFRFDNSLHHIQDCPNIRPT